jgi:hypothetical protein
MKIVETAASQTRWSIGALLLMVTVSRLAGQSISDSHSTARLYPNAPPPTPTPTIGTFELRAERVEVKPTKWVLFARPQYVRDDSVDVGGVYVGATYPGDVPFQIRVDYQRIWVRRGEPLNKIGVQAKVQRPFSAVTVSAQANYDDYRDSSRRYRAGLGFETQPFLKGLSAAGALQFGHVDPSKGATRNALIPTIELDYSVPPLFLATWYTFDNDFYLEDDFGGEASYTLSDPAAIGVGVGKHQTLYAYLQIKF